MGDILHNDVNPTKHYYGYEYCYVQSLIGSQMPINVSSSLDYKILYLRLEGVTPFYFGYVLCYLGSIVVHTRKNFELP